jgi:lipoprotein-anchoring transpeptidase ErfK/SrfK
LTNETSMNRLHLAVALILSATGATGAATAAARPVPGTQQLAVLHQTSEAHARPAGNSAAVQRVGRQRPITGEDTVLPVIAQHTDSNGAAWLKVLLPGRPNSHAGWINSRSTTAETTPWQITVGLSARQVTVRFDGKVRRRFSAVVGKASTPTPQGHFFVEENVALGPLAVGAPYGLALSARSNALRHFDGGPGQIALHGTDNIGGIPGTAASHGCVRLLTANITWLAHHIGPGTPVTIAR